MALMVRFQPGEGSCLAEARVGTSEARRQALFAGAASAGSIPPAGGRSRELRTRRMVSLRD